jgi:hypothetical protein
VSSKPTRNAKRKNRAISGVVAMNVRGAKQLFYTAAGSLIKTQ